MAEPKTKRLRISLNKANHRGQHKVAATAIKIIRKEVQKHTRTKQEHIRLSKGINEKIWQNSRTNVVHKIDLDLLEDKKLTRVFLGETDEMKTFIASQKKEDKAKKTEKKEKAEPKTDEEKTAEKDQEHKLEEKRLKEQVAQKSEFQ